MICGGYMASEYVIDGLYSMKSDLLSLGVLLLEIVSGKRNRDFHHSDCNLNLLGHVWKLWTDGEAFKIIDEPMEEPIVQKRPQDRPTMSTVLMMLDSENLILPQPKQPGFYTQRTGRKMPSNK